ncbi:MAG: SDR family NAD(P)-dependent oxidoreductase [Solirubrobacterales bacterium]
MNPAGPGDGVALVTGAARGIGEAIARRLLADGWTVLALDRDVSALSELRSSTNSSALTTMSGDVTDVDFLNEAIEVGNGFGPLVVAVANAGIFRDARIETMSDQQWSEVIGVDLSAPFHLTRAMWPSMTAVGFGRLVYISSVSKDGNYGQANYAAAKSGLLGLARTAAIEGGRHGITANVICPGSINTPLNASFRASAPAAYDRFMARVPAGRAGEPEDVAAACSFFVRVEAAYVTGQALYVDGGLACGHT